jgi:hypothetical protein
MTVKVWSEFPGRPGFGVDQCSECGYLMGLLHGGFAKFPLGAYTTVERDALTVAEVDRAASRAAGKPMFPLIDAAALKRYGRRLRTVTGSLTRATDAQLRTALSTRGNAVVLPGSYLGLPYSHPLRARARQANGSDYTGGHMVTVVNEDGTPDWLDPLRPNGEAAYPCTVEDAMAFAWSNSDAHVVRAGEFAALEDDMIDPAKHIPAGLADVGPVTVWADPDRVARIPGLEAWPGGTDIELYWTVAPPFPTPTPLVPIRLNMNGPGKPPAWKVGWVGADKVAVKQAAGGGAETRIGAASTHFADGMAALKTAEGAFVAGVTALKG